MSTSETLAAETRDGKKSGPSRKSIFFLIIVTLLNTMGMTMVGPVVPFMTLQHLHNPQSLAVIVAWLVSIYGLCQMLAAPGLGVLSDRFGRRPVLFVCLLGSAVGYLLFGFGGAIWIFFLSRIIDGLTGGNFSVLFAYIADITEPEERGKYFGLVGGFSGVGFILGPAIGGLLAGINYSVPFLFATIVILFALVWGFFFLPESLPKEHRSNAVRVRELNPLSQIGTLFSFANLRWLLIATFLYYFPFAIMQGNLTILLRDSLGWGATPAGLVATVVGVVDILVQGLLVGKMLKLFGNIKLGIGGLILVSLSYVLLGLISVFASPVLVVVAVILFAGSGGLVENALRGLISRLAGPRKQGLVGGASQSMQSFAVILGPLFGGFVYEQFGHGTPYWCGALVIVLAIGAIVLSIPTIRSSANTTEEPLQEQSA